MFGKVVEALSKPLALAKSTTRPNPNTAVSLPDWIDKAESPLAAYVEEFDDIPDEDTLLALFALERAKAKRFVFWKVVFGGGQEVYSVFGGRDEKTHSFVRPSPDFLFEREADGSYSRTTPDDFLQDISDFGRASEFFDYDPEQRFNDEFWESPVPLLHGTSDLDTVLEEGLDARNDSRGIGNRSVGRAVFATLEESIAQSYGNRGDGGVVQIDTKMMKADGYMPFVAQEPEVLEQDLLSAIASNIDVEYNIEYGDSGIDPDTVIIYGPVPAKYLSSIDPVRVRFGMLWAQRGTR